MRTLIVRLSATVMMIVTAVLIFLIQATVAPSEVHAAPCCEYCEEAVTEAHETCELEFQDPEELAECHAAAENADQSVFGCDGWCIQGCTFGCSSGDRVFCALLRKFEFDCTPYC